ncbi:hypothetical protein BDV26DRAFT_256333, partial [Aspergillus bertholletiae]
MGVRSTFALDAGPNIRMLDTLVGVGVALALSLEPVGSSPTAGVDRTVSLLLEAGLNTRTLDSAAGSTADVGLTVSLGSDSVTASLDSATGVARGLSLDSATGV